LPTPLILLAIYKNGRFLSVVRVQIRQPIHLASHYTPFNINEIIVGKLIHILEGGAQGLYPAGQFPTLNAIPGIRIAPLCIWVLFDLDGLFGRGRYGRFGGKNNFFHGLLLKLKFPLLGLTLK